MLNVQINILMWEESATAWVKIKQNQLQLPRKPKYQANTCDLTRKAVAHRLFSDSFWFCLELKQQCLRRHDETQRLFVDLPSACGQASHFGIFASLQLYFTREKHGRFFSKNHATANVLHFSQPLKCLLLEEHHQLQAFRVKDLEAICKNLHLIIFQPCRQSRLHEATKLIKPQAVFWEETPGGKSHDSPIQLEENVGRVAPVSHFHCYPHFPSQLVPPSRLGSFPADACISCTETCFMSAAGNDSGPPNMQLSIPNSETSIFPLLSASQRLKTACPKGKSVSRGSKVQSKRIEKISWTKMTAFTPFWVKSSETLAACMACPVSSELATMPWFQYGPPKLDGQSQYPVTKKNFEHLFRTDRLPKSHSCYHWTQLWGTAPNFEAPDQYTQSKAANGWKSKADWRSREHNWMHLNPKNGLLLQNKSRDMDELLWCHDMHYQGGHSRPLAGLVSRPISQTIEPFKTQCRDEKDNAAMPAGKLHWPVSGI